MITEADMKRIEIIKNRFEHIGEFSTAITNKFLSFLISKLCLIFVGIAMMILGMFVGLSGRNDDK